MADLWYDSEGEEVPQTILDESGDFYVKDNPHFIFKKHEFRPMVETADGTMVPMQGVIAIRPVPPPHAVTRATLAMNQGTDGVWAGTTFIPPPGCQPDAVFASRLVKESFGLARRFIIRRKYVPAVAGPKTMCIYTDGACSNNGSVDPRAPPRGGAAFVYHEAEDGTVRLPLEREGPDGIEHTHTSNRAELRAVLGALAFRVWWGSGFQQLVVITDSEYVAKGATEWLRSWARRGWRTSTGLAVKNRDLWELLSEQMGEYAKGGCEVSFWAVPRHWNKTADQAAKEAAAQGDVPQKFMNPLGIAC